MPAGPAIGRGPAASTREEVMPTVLITGANRGIGLEFARQYAADGWHVIATYRDLASAQDLLALPVESHRLEVADFAEVEDLGRRLANRPIDVLVNNAGTYGGSQAFGSVDMGDWATTLRTNAMAPLKLAETFRGNLVLGGRKTFAALSSRMGSMGDNTSGGAYIYRSSKAALNAVVKSLAIDLAPLGIVAFMLHPGWVKTRMGGANSLITAAESVQGMRRLIEQAVPARVGRFYNYDGQEIPW